MRYGKVWIGRIDIMSLAAGHGAFFLHAGGNHNGQGALDLQPALPPWASTAVVTAKLVAACLLNPDPSGGRGVHVGSLSWKGAPADRDLKREVPA